MRIHYSITKWNEKVTVSGVKVSENFAARKPQGDRCWHLDHLPTGYYVPFTDCKTLGEIKRIAVKIERIRNWKLVTEGHRAKLPRRHAYAVVLAAKGRKVAAEWLRTRKRMDADKRAAKRKAA